MLTLCTILLIGYLLGAIPTSLLVSKRLYKIDIREHGSHNAGLTNILRVLGWKPAVIVFIVDLSKGLGTVLMAPHIQIGESVPPFSAETLQILAGCFAIIGHIWTVFANFKGGKGVLCAMGVYLGLAPVPVLISFSIFVVIVSITRYVSLGSMISASSLPIILVVQHFVLHKPVSLVLFVIAAATALLIVVTHRSNISRLRAGNENKIGIGKGVS